MASWEKENRIDISEQRKNLNKLEEEIERELAELENLNKSAHGSNKRIRARFPQQAGKEEASQVKRAEESEAGSSQRRLSVPGEYFSRGNVAEKEKEEAECVYSSVNRVHMPHPEPFSNQHPDRVEDVSVQSRADDLRSLSKDQIMDLVKQLENKEPFREEFALKEQAPNKQLVTKALKPKVEDRLMQYGEKKFKNRQEKIEEQERVVKRHATPTLSKRASSQQPLQAQKTVQVSKTVVLDEEDSSTPTLPQPISENNNTSISHYISLYEAEYGESNVNSARPPSGKFMSGNYANNEAERTAVANYSSKSTTPRGTTVNRKGNQESTEQQESFRPNFNKKSLELASRMGDPFQRLVAQNGERQKEFRKKTQQEMERDLTFKPKINATSAALDRNFKNNMFNGDQLYRWDQLYLMKDKYKIDKQMRKLEIEKEIMEHDECTFHPDTSTSKYHIQRNENRTVADRSRVWEEQRQQKILRERQENEEKELDGCTFKPHLEAEKSKDLLSKSVLESGLEAALTIRGADKHFERIELAKRIKMEKESQLARNQGKNWRNKVTVPKEPKLGRHDSHSPNAPMMRNSSLSPMHASFVAPANKSYASRRQKSVHTVVEYEESETLRELPETPSYPRAQHSTQSQQYQQQQRYPQVSKQQQQQQQQQYGANEYYDTPVMKEDEDVFTDAIAQLHNELHKIRF